MPVVVSPVSYEELASPSSQATGRLETANGLVASFRYLCSRGARKFVREGIERSDLEQVAAIGLIKASRRFDRANGTPFEAYAWLMIVGELMHYVRDHDYPVRLPRRLLALERDVADTGDAFLARFERMPTDREVATALEIPVELVAGARGLRRRVLPACYDDSAPGCARDEGLDQDDRLALAIAFASLGTLERRIVGGVYLLGLTQTQLARSLDLPPKRVSRIHLGALARMRHAWPA